MEKEFKVVFVPRVEVTGEPAEFISYHDTLRAAEVALSAIANYTLFLHECSFMPDWSNFGFVCRKDGDEWVEIDGDGNEI